MQAGVTILSGLVGEYASWDPVKAWSRAVEMGEVAERLGFAFVWVPDHLRAVRGPDDAPTFEAFTLLAAIAGRTERVWLGPGVACAGFRNPAPLVKMAMFARCRLRRPRRPRRRCRVARVGVAQLRLRLPADMRSARPT